jgi:cytochrome c oxidase subunit I+III
VRSSETATHPAAWVGAALFAISIACFLFTYALTFAGQPSQPSHGADAAVNLLLALEGFYATVLLAMGLFTLARRRAGLLDGVRRAVYDNTRIFWHYVAAQSLAGLALVHGFPRLVGP